MATILGKPGVLLFGRTTEGAIVPMLVDASGALVESSESLPFQVENDGDPVLLNESGDTILSVDGNGNPKLQGWDGSHTSQGSINFDIDGKTTVLGGSGSTNYFLVGNSASAVGAAQLFSGDGQGLVFIGSGDNYQFVLNIAGNHSNFSFNNPIIVSIAGNTASYTTDLGVANADLVWTAGAVGQAGNAYTIEYEDPGDINQPLTVTWSDPSLNYSLETDGTGAIVTTAQDIIDIGTDGAPISASLADGSDGSGVVVDFFNVLSGGLSALNVAGPSWLDDGAIWTSGEGNLIATSGFTASESDGSSALRLNSGGLIAQGTDTDIDVPITAKGAGTINLNSPLVADSGAITTDGSGGIDTTGYVSVNGVGHGILLLPEDGGSPTLRVTGDDTDISLALEAQGTGTINFNSDVVGSGSLTIDEIIPASDSFNVNGVVSGDYQSYYFKNTSATAGAGTELEVTTVGNAATGHVGLRIKNHEDASNEAAFSLLVAGDSGNDTPNTTFTFPGAALFADADGYDFDDSVTAPDFNGFGLLTGIDATVPDFALTTSAGNGDFIVFRAHDVDDAVDRIFATLTSGNTPDFSIVPPSGGTVTLQATTFKSADGSTGATGSGTVISAITVKNGLITSITVA